MLGGMEIDTSAARVHLTCTVNGEDVRLDLDPRESLLNALRERLALTGTAGRRPLRR